MARTVQIACPRCGHQQMYVVESTENSEAVPEAARVSDVADDATKSAALRLQRLKSLPTSLPVGGIITPV